MRMSKGVASALGALTGLLGLIAMIRLVAGAGFTSMFAWVFLLAAMLPWLGYCVWRARHGQLRPRSGLVVLVLDAVGFISVWIFTFGPVLALACSLLAFIVIWVHDWPQLRERRESEYVRVEELTFAGADDEDDAAADRPMPAEAGGAWQVENDRDPGRPDVTSGLTTETPRTAA